MGKNKRNKLAPGGSKKNKQIGKGARPVGITKPQSKSSLPTPKKHVQVYHTVPTIPFSPSDGILLIGEGDLSFSRSLVEHHQCEDVTATVFEKEEELKEKYPQVEENIEILREYDAKIKFSVDAMKGGGIWKESRGKVDRVIFNFPHVGGKSTDVNRQVRYNQELLVAFFKHALPSLARSTPNSTSSIIVTLFEGEPYTLWNIRDLARHSGLQVEKSFKFQAKAYPGYRHARTLGVVKSKNGEEGGWRGEERSSRTYILVRKGEATPPGTGAQGKKKDDISEDEEDDNGSAFDAFEKEGGDILDGFGDSDVSAAKEDSESE